MRTLQIAKFENVGPEHELDRLRSRLSSPPISCLQGSVQSSTFLIVEATEDEKVVGVATDERTAEAICTQLGRNPRRYTMLNRKFLYEARYKFIRTSLFSRPADAAALRPIESEEIRESASYQGRLLGHCSKCDEPYYEPFTDW